ncbi:unnamed protein product [Caenorhabditis auriculariae]|uniref:Fucosyltransferase n=1 Tax=Caenorhabditis auriculariae TaxID=2777116 RepID=A0A8S1HRC7_9PELO|nr:unnamed protein product [Caenorhabditis auriculariae]
MNITTERFLSKCHSTKGYCRISEDPKDLDVADAILFHNADFSPEKVPMPRLRNRPHVIWSLESPAHDSFRPLKDVINWTMTYRLDADIWYPYGHFVRRKSPQQVDYEAIWAAKDQTKIATWLASNCFSQNRRFDLIKKLIDKGLPLDSWGRCGKKPPNCKGISNQGSPCVVDLIRPYKFYMSVENSNCLNYVTEKFYETLRSRMAVPIVLSRKFYRQLGAPDDAFIAIDDFKSLDELIFHVKKVAADKELYLKYHKWRETHEVKPEHDDTTGFCELCRRLQNSDLGSKSYADLAWWHGKHNCNQFIADRFLGPPTG